MVLHINLPENAYDIYLERGVLYKASELLNLNRRCLVVTDDGVPTEYAKAIADACKYARIVTLKQGEATKSFENFKLLLEIMLEENFTRTDCAIAVGGGVIGDLTGFAAASYMRGVDFYNIPTTLLSQVDSSIGGKVAINLNGVKNIVGAFYQPKRVLIDPKVLKTLPPRQISNGLAESLKMGLTSDVQLFEIFEKGEAFEKLEKVIELSLRIKADVVEKDERETGLRKILNFGHTLAHGIESEEKLVGLYHGECVGLGMIPMCGEELRPRLVNVLKSINLPVTVDGDLEAMLDAAAHDKKCDGDNISVVSVNVPGNFVIEKISLETWKNRVRTVLKEISK